METHLGGVLARARDTVIALTSVRAYPQGVLATVEVWMRPGTQLDPHWLAPPPGPPDRQFRFGWLLAEGVKVGSRLDDVPDDRPGSEQLAGPWMALSRVADDELSGTFRLWLWPMPSGRRVDLVVTSPDRWVPETFHALDLETIRAAALGCETLWEVPTLPSNRSHEQPTGPPAWRVCGSAVRPIPRSASPLKP